MDVLYFIHEFAGLVCKNIFAIEDGLLQVSVASILFLSNRLFMQLKVFDVAKQIKHDGNMLQAFCIYCLYYCNQLVTFLQKDVKDFVEVWLLCKLLII
jgi:hypothetical protein